MLFVPSLPTELWLEIGSFILLLDPQRISLSRLSQTCRLLHSIFSSWIEDFMLERLGSTGTQIITHIEPPQARSKDGPRLNARFKHLSLSLQALETLDTIRCVRYLLLHAESVSEVVIDHSGLEVDFAVVVCCWTACVQGATSVTLKEYGPRSYGRARLEEGAAFQLVPQVQPQGSPGHIAIAPNASRPLVVETIARLVGWFSSFRKQSSAPATSYRPSHTNPTTSQKTEWVLRPREPLFPIQLPSRPLLVTHLHLSARELFTASMYPWTMHILNNAPIVDLFLDVNLSVIHWEHILPLIHVPTLTHFGVGNIPIAIPDFLKFFDRHNALVSINLTCSEAIGPLDMPSTYHNSSFLPFLRTLIAPPEYTLLFLKHRQIGFLPQLKTFELKPWKYESTTGGAWKGERWHRDQFFSPIFNCLAKSSQAKGLHLKLYAMALISFIEWTLHAQSQSHEIPQFCDVDTIQAVYTAELLSSSLVEQVKPLTQRRGVVRETAVEDTELDSAAVDLEGKSRLVHALFCIVCPNHAAFTANYRDSWISLPA